MTAPPPVSSSSKAAARNRRTAMSDSLAIQRGDTAPPLPPEGLLARDLNPLLDRAAALATERMKPVVALAFFLGLALGVAAMILIARWPAVAAALAERAV
jgi:hypothetical protein